ncbi:MAG TPA: hypothetical protein VMZ49_03600 [Patescibacteria group bacterium]|nr:hypothetical protein [Patescibacteria group bacterium]
MKRSITLAILLLAMTGAALFSATPSSFSPDECAQRRAHLGIGNPAVFGISHGVPDFLHCSHKVTESSIIPGSFSISQ